MIRTDYALPIKLAVLAVALVWSCRASAQDAPPPGVQVQNSGSVVGQSAKVNFTGSAVTSVVKSGGVTTVTLTDTTAAGGTTAIQDEGSALTSRATLNFTGAGVSCADNAGSTRTDCTIAGGGGSAPTYIGDFGINPNWEQIRSCTSNNTNAGSVVCTGIDPPSSTGTAGNGSAASGHFYWSHQTTATIGNAAGYLFAGSPSVSQGNARVRFKVLAYTDSATTSRRYWFAVASASLSATSATIASAANTNVHVGIAYDSAVSANWLCCAGNGTNKSCVDSGLAYAANTLVLLDADNTTSGTLTCKVTPFGGSTTTTTNSATAPTTSTALYSYNLSGTALAASAIQIRYAWWQLITR